MTVPETWSVRVFRPQFPKILPSSPNDVSSITNVSFPSRVPYLFWRATRRRSTVRWWTAAARARTRRGTPLRRSRRTAIFGCLWCKNSDKYYGNKYKRAINWDRIKKVKYSFLLQFNVLISYIGRTRSISVLTIFPQYFVILAQPLVNSSSTGCTGLTIRPTKLLIFGHWFDYSVAARILLEQGESWQNWHGLPNYNGCWPDG